MLKVCIKILVDMIWLIMNLKDICHETWSERFKNLRIDMTLNKIEGKYRTFNGGKNIYNECCPETTAF